MNSHTEAEAKDKWCPLSSVVPGRLVGGTMHAGAFPVHPHNRVQIVGGDNTEEATWHQAHCCIGSLCMAWQWVEPNRSQERTDGTGIVDKAPGRGYCGAFARRS